MKSFFGNDLCHLPQLTEAFKGIKKVYHCAAYVSMAYYKKVPQEVNQEGTAFLVNLCIKKRRKTGVHQLIAALGSQTTGRIENTPWNPTIEKTPYAYSKYGAERGLARRARRCPYRHSQSRCNIGNWYVSRGPLEQLVNQIKSGLRFIPLAALVM